MKAREITEDTTRRGFLGGMLGALAGASGSAAAMGNKPPRDVPVRPVERTPPQKPAQLAQPRPQQPQQSQQPQRPPFSPRQHYGTLVNLAVKSGITQIRDLANLLGNCEIETLNWTSPVESFIYRDPKRLSGHFTSVFPTPDSAREWAGKTSSEDQQKLANLVYKNKNGNIDPDDGWLYRGRGFMHLTGRENYERAGKEIHGDPQYYLKNPDIVATDPVEGARTAVWYFLKRVGLGVADPVAASKRINPSSKIRERVEAINKFRTKILPRDEAIRRIQRAQTQVAAGSAQPTRKAGIKEEWTDSGTHEQRVYQRLHKLGYEQIGHGMDATVWARDSGSVIKLIMPTDEGTINTAGWRTFMKFYRFCRQHQDLDCIPRFRELEGRGGAQHSRITIDGIPHLQIGMERLQPLEQDSPRTAVVWALSDLATKNVTWEEAYSTMEDDPHLWSNLEMDPPLEMGEITDWIWSWSKHERAQWAVLYNTMRLLYHTGRINKVGWDLHTENVMLRGDTVVITDPWFTERIEEL